MPDSINVGIEKQSLIKKLETKTTDSTNQINTKTPDMPNDKVELSTKQDEKKSLYQKIALAGAAALALAGAAIYIKKHPGKADTMIKEGRQKLNEAETKAKQQADEAAKELEESIEKANQKREEIRANINKQIEESNKNWEKQRELAKKAAAEQKYAKDIKTANDFLKDSFGKTDDEIADILQARYNDNLLGPEFKLLRAFIDNKNFVADAIIEKASTVKNPVEKERLLVKALDYVSESTEHYYVYTNIEKFREINGRLNSLYKTQTAEFKHKDTIQKTITQRINKFFNSTEESKNLTEALGSEADYELYKTLCKKSKEYINCFREKENPMGILGYTDPKNDKSLRAFLHDTLPKLFGEEKNIVKKEDLWFKYLHVTRNYTYNKHTEKSFEILRQMNENFYKTEIKLPKGETLKYKEEIQSQLKETIDEFIFKQFDIPAIKTEEEKMALAKKVIVHLNAPCFWYKPEDVQVEHITKGLMQLAKETKNEKYIEAAVDAAISKNEKRYASLWIKNLLNSDEKLSPRLQEKLKKIQDDFLTQSKKTTQEIADAMKAKTLKEAFETFTSRTETKDAIKELAKTHSLTEAEIIQKMQNGDGMIIRSVIKDALFNSKAESILYNSKPSPIWEEIVTYIDKLDTVVKDKKELEYLENIKLRALGALVRITKTSAPEKSEGYREILRRHVTDMLYTKGVEGKLAKESINEEAVNAITDYFDQLILVFIPEHTMFGAIERLLERPLRYEADTVKVLRTKMQEIKNRLKIKTEEDFYNEFRSRFNSGSSGRSRASSKVSANTALDTLNKYLEGDKLHEKSTKAEIKSAYRRLALKYHPDSCKEADKAAYEEIFKEIGAAYGALR